MFYYRPILSLIKMYVRFCRSKAKVPRKPARMMARPQNEVIGLRDYHQFFFFFHNAPTLLSCQNGSLDFFEIALKTQTGKAVKPLSGKSSQHGNRCC